MLSCGTQSNPYQLAAVSWGDLRVNANIVDYMNAYGDPRMPKFFNKSTLAGKTDKYVGMRTGDADFKKADAAGFSIPAYTATSKLMVFCAAETAFLRAEGKLRGWNVGSKTAKAYYEDGINLSMEQYQDVYKRQVMPMVLVSNIYRVWSCVRRLPSILLEL